MKRKRTFTIIQIGNIEDWPSRIYDIIIMLAVALNIIIGIFDTFPRMAAMKDVMYIIEALTVIFFTADYFLRVWTADFLYEGVSPLKAKIKFIFSFAGLVDFASCIPFFFFRETAVLRILRIIRILRIFRINNYSDPLNRIIMVIRRKRGQLISSTFIVLVLMVTSSLLMYYLENPAQPEIFANAFSGFWWAASTLLTVGYGDIVPVTLAGKICGTVLTFLGVGMIAIPTGILSAGFMEQDTEILKEKSEEPHYCPHCGHKL